MGSGNHVGCWGLNPWDQECASAFKFLPDTLSGELSCLLFLRIVSGVCFHPANNLILIYLEHGFKLEREIEKLALFLRESCRFT